MPDPAVSGAIKVVIKHANNVRPKFAAANMRNAARYLQQCIQGSVNYETSIEVGF